MFSLKDMFWVCSVLHEIAWDTKQITNTDVIVHFYHLYAFLELHKRLINLALIKYLTNLVNQVIRDSWKLWWLLETWGCGACWYEDLYLHRLPNRRTQFLNHYTNLAGLLSILLWKEIAHDHHLVRWYVFSSHYL